ncbi:unnamed protein product, partial [Discosporangium mesarthrocarpum]
QVFAWDEVNNTPHDLGADADGKTPRSYLSCVSEILSGETCIGTAKKERGECRMDIVDSEIGYMGYKASESYGLTWKVRGLCIDLSNAATIFERVSVYGDILNSDIHHMWYGMYSYGHQGGVWNNNIMHDNHEYGFDPHDDSDYLTIHNNIVFNNGNHGIIASKRCNHVSIQNNHVYSNRESGIMLHRSSDYAVVKGNYVHDNYQAGLALVESSNLDVQDNIFVNHTWGIRLTLGASDNQVSQHASV